MRCEDKFKVMGNEGRLAYDRKKRKWLCKPPPRVGRRRRKGRNDLLFIGAKGIRLKNRQIHLSKCPTELYKMFESRYVRCFRVYEYLLIVALRSNIKTLTLRTENRRLKHTTSCSNIRRLDRRLVTAQNK